MMEKYKMVKVLIKLYITAILIVISHSQV